MEAFRLPHSPTLPDARIGMAVLAVMAVAELSETVPPGQARGFFLALGRRMAGQEALDGVKDAAVLSARINAFWNALGWGEAEIILQADGILVRHHRTPREIGGDGQERWPMMLLAVLEGAYDAWFRQMGSGPSLKTTAQWNGETAELRHGT